ncbi:MAG TPA: FAD:protein FMN transferase [Acholeplasmataceae bacterium]|nr:FAD:protein FMN transferase [Acholeplasmataceae bacterium]
MKKIYVLVLLLICTPLLVSCKSKEYDFVKINLGYVFSISPEVIIVDTKDRLTNDAVSKLSSDLREIVTELDETYDVIDNEDGLISKINQNAGVAPVKVNDEVIMILKTAVDVSEKTKIDDNALYDISVYPVWDLWNFDTGNYQEEAEIPTQEEINAALPLVGYDKIIIDEENKTVFLKEKGMKIDLGSIVKGYACDKIKEYLLSVNYQNALINVGGNIMTMGHDYYDKYFEDSPWRVKISTPYFVYNPFDPKSQLQYFVGTFYYHDITVVSSGVYERYIVNDGKEYHHILNPKTGYPVDSGLISISIVTDDSMKADALSTAVFCMGLERGVEYINTLENVEAVFITDNKEVYITKGLEDNFIFNNEIEELGYTYKGVKNGTSN